MSRKSPEPVFESRLFRRLDDFGTGARNVLERQSREFLRIWDRAIQKDTPIKDVLGDTIRLWASSMEETFELMTSPLRDTEGKDRTPASLVFVLDSRAEAANAKCVASPIELDANQVLAATDLRRLDGEGGALDSKHVVAKADAGGDVISVELVQIGGKLRPGHYGGLVYVGGPGAPGQPLVVLNVFVVEKQHSSIQRG